MEYLIKDFGTKEVPSDPPVLRICHDANIPDSEKTLWHELNNAKVLGKKISVYQLPDCVLDWS